MKILFTVSFFTLALSAQGKTLDRYQASVKVENANGGQAGEIFQAIAGLTCTSSLSAAHKEKIMNHKRKKIPKTFAHTSDFTMTAFAQPQGQFDFPVNFKNDGVQFSMQVTENCSGRIPKVTTCQDQEGNSYPCVRDEYVNIPFSYSCSVDGREYPRVGSREFTCNPQNDYAYFNAFTSDNILRNLLLQYMRSKKFTMTLSHLGQDFRYENYNCPQNMDLAHIDPSVAKILQFRGGVSGGMFSHDYQFNVAINGGPELTKAREDGITNFDLLYCLSQGDRDLDVRVTAKDGDKVYTSDRTVKFDARNAVGPAQDVELSRPRLWGWGKYKGVVSVDVAN